MPLVKNHVKGHYGTFGCRPWLHGCEEDDLTQVLGCVWCDVAAVSLSIGRFLGFLGLLVEGVFAQNEPCWKWNVRNFGMKNTNSRLVGVVVGVVSTILDIS